jgi:hypothetical protein
MTTMTIYHTCGDIECRNVRLPDAPSYDALRSVLRPVFGEHHPQQIRVFLNGRRGDMFIDERGPQLGLPANQAATEIFRSACLERVAGSDARGLATIVGPAVIFSRQVWF